MSESEDMERRPYVISEAALREANERRDFVRAFIVNTALPKTIREVYEEAIEELGHESNRYDIESVLQGEPYECWSVPKWAKLGDVIFFMLARTSAYAAKRLAKEYELEKPNYSLAERNTIEPMLLRAQWLTGTYAGKLVGVGRVASLPFVSEPALEHSHYQGRIFADISDVVLFERPVDIDEFSDFQQIRRGMTVTPVLGHNFTKLREVISKGNRLPNYVLNAVATPDFCRNITSENWMSLSEKYRRSFMLEDEFRSCYLDYLLAELSEGPVYKEVRVKKASGFGVVDNVVVLGGKYVYVEAKLDVLAEAHLERQLHEYCHARSITLESDVEVSGRRACNNVVLVFDTEAAYLYMDEKPDELRKLFSLDRCAELGTGGMRDRILGAMNG